MNTQFHRPARRERSRRRLPPLLLPLLIVLPLAAGASSGWERYRLIVERKPFGKEPPPAPAKPAETRPEGVFAKAYRLCMLYTDAEGDLKAGLVSKTNNRNVFLKAGETDPDENLTLVEIRFEEGLAVLEKNGERAQLLLEGLGGAPAQAVAAAGPAAAPKSTAVRVVRRPNETVSQQIRDALTDNRPKRARMVVNRKKQKPALAADGGGAGGSAAQHGSSGRVFGPDSRSGGFRPADSMAAVSGGRSGSVSAVSPQSSGGNGYALSRVPRHIAEKLKKDGRLN